MTKDEFKGIVVLTGTLVEFILLGMIELVVFGIIVVYGVLDLVILVIDIVVALVEGDEGLVELVADEMEVESLDVEGEKLVLEPG